MATMQCQVSDLSSFHVISISEQPPEVASVEGHTCAFVCLVFQNTKAAHETAGGFCVPLPPKTLSGEGGLPFLYSQTVLGKEGRPQGEASDTRNPQEE